MASTPGTIARGHENATPRDYGMNGVAVLGILAMVRSMSTSWVTQQRTATERHSGGQWNSAAIPAEMRPASWWALLIGAPPTSS